MTTKAAISENTASKQALLTPHAVSSPKRAILILGMHRSGTSALTRILGLRGVALPLNSVAAGPDNVTGFWEPTEIVNTHEQVFESAGFSWTDAAEFPATWFHSDAAPAFKARLIAALSKAYPEHATLLAIKDPRLCHLVPLWLGLLQERGIEPLFIIPVRNPLEVAASLKQRNGLQQEHSLLLWLRHFLAAERGSRGFKRSFVCYDMILEDWRHALDTLGLDLGVVWPRQSVVPDVEIDRFISTELRHHRSAVGEIHAQRHVSEWVKATFRWALRAVDHQSADFDELDEIATALRTADVAYMPLIADRTLVVHRLEQALQRLTEQFTEKDNELAHLLGQTQSDQTSIQLLRTEVAAASLAQSVLQQELQSAHSDALRVQAEQSAALSSAEKRIETLQAALKQTRGELASLRTQHDRLVGSLYWRVTGPIRSAAAALSPTTRRRIRLGLKAAYWIATPGRTRQRLAFLRKRRSVAPARVDSGKRLDACRKETETLAAIPGDAAARALGRAGDTGEQIVSVGIVVHDTPLGELRRLITSARMALGRCGGTVSGEVRVIDNGDSVDPADLPPDIIFDRSPNLGFGSGHNQCMNEAFKAGATAYVAANPDGSFHPDCIRNLLTMHHAHHERALIEARQFPDEHPKTYDPVDLTTTWTSGACLLIPRSIWQCVGGFDPNFFMYCEDVDLSWRCRASGFKTVICPSALFWHDISGRDSQPWRWGEMLVAGRYLAYKWNNTRFFDWTEQQLLAGGFADTRDELPPLDDLPIIADKTNVSDFSFDFHFSPVRW